MKKNLVVLNSMSTGHRWVVSLQIKDEADLEELKKILVPHGFTFRFPKRG